MRVTANLKLDREQWAGPRVAGLIAAAPSPVVSDIGAGFGWMRPHVEKAGGVWQGFDVTPKVAGVRAWDLGHPAPESAARPGVVALLEVVEHLRDPWRGLEHVVEHLLPGGHLVLSTPNPGWSRSRVYMLHHGCPSFFSPRQIGEQHVFTPWPHLLFHGLETLHLEVIEYVTLYGPARWPAAAFTTDYVKSLCITAACKTIEHFDETSREYSYGLVARKPAEAG